MEITQPCTVCAGDKIIRDGEMHRTCPHCKGTGTEPPPSESELEQAGQLSILGGL